MYCENGSEEVKKDTESYPSDVHPHSQTPAVNDICPTREDSVPFVLSCMEILPHVMVEVIEGFPLARRITYRRSTDQSIDQVNTLSTNSSLPDRSSWNRTRTYTHDLRLASVHLLSPQRSTWLRPLDRNEAACLQKGYKPIRVVYTEQPLTARILVDGSKVRLFIRRRMAPPPSSIAVGIADR